MDIYLGLGSNLGDRRDNLTRALRELAVHGARSRARVARRRVAGDAARRRTGRLESTVSQSRRSLPHRGHADRHLGRLEADRARARPRGPRPVGAAADRSRPAALWPGDDRVRAAEGAAPRHHRARVRVDAARRARAEPHHSGARHANRARACARRASPSAALDGHRESDARFVLRRRRARDDGRRRTRTPRSSRPPAPRSSTSAPSRRGPARRRYRPTKNGRGSSPRSAASSTAIAASCCGRGSASTPTTSRRRAARSRAAPISSTTSAA